MKNLQSETEELSWLCPEYELMLPKLQEAHIEIGQLRYAIEQGGLMLKEPIKRHGTEYPTSTITDKERKAILGMLIQEGNKRLQEISDIKSYLEAVEKDGMLKVKSGYIFGFALEDDGDFEYIWSPSGLKADHFIMTGTFKNGAFTLDYNHSEMDESMLLSIDFSEILELFTLGKVPK